MGLSAAGIKLNLTLWQRGFYKNTRCVLDMGAQDLNISRPQFDALLEAAGLREYPREDFVALDYFPGIPRSSTKPFYKLLGISDYTCTDLVGGPEVVKVDLNLPLQDERMLGKYDLVTDYGNNEHPFNMPEAFRTMHRLCKAGGIMLIQQGVLWGNGYYNFDESFFESLAAANGYGILFSSYVVTLKKDMETGKAIQLHIPLCRDLLNALNFAEVSHIEISYAFRKQVDADFQYPYDGWTFGLKSPVACYELSFLPDPPTRAYVPLLRSDLLDLPLSIRNMMTILGRRMFKRTAGMLSRRVPFFYNWLYRRIRLHQR